MHGTLADCLVDTVDDRVVRLVNWCIFLRVALRKFSDSLRGIRLVKGAALTRRRLCQRWKDPSRQHSRSLPY